MYLGNGYNFSSLDSFVAGFTTAASDRQLELNDYPNFRYFSTWLLGHLKKHFGLSGGWHWQLSNRNFGNDEKCFEDFFEFLETFKKSKTHRKSITLNAEAMEFHKSGHVKRLEVVDGKEVKIHDDPFKIEWITMDNSSTVWLDYFDKTGNIIREDIWSINSDEATKKLTDEFGIYLIVE